MKETERYYRDGARIENATFGVGSLHCEHGEAGHSLPELDEVSAVTARRILMSYQEHDGRMFAIQSMMNMNAQALYETACKVSGETPSDAGLKTFATGMSTAMANILLAVGALLHRSLKQDEGCECPDCVKGRARAKAAAADPQRN